VNFAPKIKKKVAISRRWIFHFGLFYIFLLILFLNIRTHAQDISPVPAPESSSDSLNTANQPLVLPDTIPKNSLNRPDTAKTNSSPVGDITTTVKYKAKDSINMDLRKKIVKMFGSSSIDYKPISVVAAEIEIDWNENTIAANGVEDSTGKVIGKPVFKNGSENYETNDIRYNFKTQKAVISGMVTEQGDGYIHGDVVYKNEDNELYIPHTKYTTCSYAHPHYYIAARNVKAIPNNKMVTGPFNMVINDVPTPLGFFFGMFPQQKHRSSGLIFPSWGEQTLKGFYLENLGYYFGINDYVSLALSGSAYSKGGFGVNIESRYIKRYKYGGNFMFNLSQQNLSTDTEGNDGTATDFRVTWGHTPQTKGTGRFSARVNAATSTYNQNNVLPNYEAQINTTLSSNVSYSKSFQGTPISMGISGRFNQNVRTRKVDLLLPEFSANVQNLYPFQSKAGGGNNWYSRLTLRYTMKGINKITNQISPDSIAPFDFNTLPTLLENAQKGVKHTIPITTSVKALKFFTLSPSINYEELWYSSKLDHFYDSTSMTIIRDTIPGFTRVYSYNTGASLNTRVYGTYFFNREYGIQAIRHIITPSISYSYRPDFSDPKFDYYQEIQSDENGKTELRARYTGYVYGMPSPGESSSLSFSMTNTLEMKVKSRKDTTGQTQKVMLIRNFGLSTGYNFAADSFNLSSIALRANTNLLNNKEVFGGSATLQATNINIAGTIDPYVWIVDSIGENLDGSQKYYQRRIDRYAWNNGDGLGTLSVVTLNLRSGIKAKPKRRGGSSPVGTAYSTDQVSDLRSRLESGTLSYQQELMIENILNNPQSYVDFNIPWGVNVSYSLNYRRVGFAEGKITQTLTFNGDLNLSPKWKLTYTSGYDFQAKEFTQTRITLNRDLHCWELNFGWVPFGRFTSYDFSIRAKSSLLQDLKINRRRSFTDNL